MISSKAKFVIAEANVRIEEPLVREIVRRVRTVAKPQKMILFGSAATGTMTADSDVDLLIVQAQPGDQREDYVRVRRALRGLGYPFDVLFISREWFEESKDVIGGIAYPANRYGKVIYEAPRAAPPS